MKKATPEIEEGKDASWTDSLYDGLRRSEVEQKAAFGETWAMARVLAWQCLEISETLGRSEGALDHRTVLSVERMWKIHLDVQTANRLRLVDLVERASQDERFAARVRNDPSAALLPHVRRPLRIRRRSERLMNHEEDQRRLVEAFDDAVKQWPRRSGPRPRARKATKQATKWEAIARFVSLWMREPVSDSALDKDYRRKKKLK